VSIATWRRGSIGSPRSRGEGSDLIRRLVYVAFFLEVGLLLLVLPWSAFWEHNYFAEAWPPLQPLLTNNFTRGAVTGLGLVNLGAGFADLARVFWARGPRDVSVPDGTPRS
jgi:polyferredoxin